MIKAEFWTKAQSLVLLILRNLKILGTKCEISIALLKYSIYLCLLHSLQEKKSLEHILCSRNIKKAQNEVKKYFIIPWCKAKLDNRQDIADNADIFWF